MVVLLLSPPCPDREGILAPMLAAGHYVLLAESAAQAFSSSAGQAVDVYVVDLAGGADALKFIRKYRGQPAQAPIVCVADRRRADAVSEALRLGAVDIVARPVRAGDVAGALANAREFAHIARTAPVVPDVSDDGEDAVVWASPAMRDVLAIVRRVASSRCAVLIVGERGTGREMIAQAIYAQGTRRDQPFVKIVCGDTTSVEFERLLAGELAPGTMVFLDDVGELWPEGQLRLQAFIRDRVENARDSRAEGAPLRFVAAAEPSVFEAADRGTFRRGLLDVLGIVRIDLPPLRQRPEDIPLLATMFVKDACRRADVTPKTFSRSALTLLAALPWVGNAAELRSLTERLAVLVPRGVVLLEDVLANVRFEHAEALGRPRDSLRVARERFERDYVAAVLQHHRGRIGAAARELGIERTNLYRKIRQLNIQWALPDERARRPY